MKKINIKRFWTVLTALVLIVSLTACGSKGTEPTKSNDNAESSKTSSEEEAELFAQVVPGTITFSHGCILKAYKYPYWKAMSKDLKTNELKEMVRFDDCVYIDGDKDMEAHFCEDSQAFPSTTQDLLYVYTMPEDANIDLEITTQVSEKSDDGITVYCTINGDKEYLIERTEVVYTGVTEIIGKYNVDLKKGDVLYCGYSGNQNTDGDGGNYYVKLTYNEVG